MQDRHADQTTAVPAGAATSSVPRNPVTVLIPAFQPDAGLPVLVRDLMEEGLDRILLVDDGSGAAYESIFALAAETGCTVLRLDENRGQGRAIKIGLEAILASGVCDSAFDGSRTLSLDIAREKVAHSSGSADQMIDPPLCAAVPACLGVVLADANSDFSASQIRLVADALVQTPDTLILGSRQFSGHIPMHRRFGRRLISQLFATIHGSRIEDLQTGLRGLPASRLALFASLPGEGYDYEFNMLLAVKPNDIPLRQLPIPMAYHPRIRLHPLRRHLDLWRMAALLLRFLASSLLTTGLEYALFFTLMHFRYPGRLLISVIVSKAIGALANFWINCKLVFRRESALGLLAVRYSAVQALVIAGSYSLISLFHHGLGLTTFLSKLISDIILYFFSFFLQREWVYKTREK